MTVRVVFEMARGSYHLIVVVAVDVACGGGTSGGGADG